MTVIMTIGAAFAVGGVVGMILLAVERVLDCPVEYQDKDGGMHMNRITGWRLRLGHHVFELSWTRPNMKHPGWDVKKEKP